MVVLKNISTFIFLLYCLILNTGIYAKDREKIDQLNFSELQGKDTVVYDSCRVTCPLDFYGETLPGFTSFSHSIFEKEIDFGNSNLTIVHLSESSFSSEINMRNVKFKSEADFSNSVFKGGVDFRGSEYFSTVSFKNDSFYLAADFSGIVLSSNAKADFSYTKFIDDAIFSYAKFNSHLDLSNVKFDSLADFKEVEFNGDVDFSYATLPKFLDFSLVQKISNEIDLTRCADNQEYGECIINLSNAAVDKFRFRYNRFKLWFPEESTYDLRANVYEMLLEVQKKEGFTQSYEKLDKEYQEFKYVNKEGSLLPIWGHLQNWVAKHWWNYGYDKGLVIRNVILIYLLLSIINVFVIKYLTTNVYEDTQISEWSRSVNGPRYKIMIKTVPFSLFYTAQIFFGFKLDMNKIKYKENLEGWKIFNLLYIFMIYLGGLTCLAFLMNYVFSI